MLILENVEKYYRDLHVIKDISAEFHFGCCYLLLGDNGAGKSTLAKCIAGDEVIDKGSIRINEQHNVADLAVIQYQFFDSYSLLKVKEVIRRFTQLIEKPTHPIRAQNQRDQIKTSRSHQSPTRTLANQRAVRIHRQKQIQD